MPPIPPIVPAVIKIVPPPIRKHLPWLVVVGIVGAAAIGFGSSGFGTILQTAPPSGSCALATPAFCDTFDAPAGNGNRSGQLNGTIWGVSRTTGNNNPGQGVNNGWFPTTLQACDGPHTVAPPQDVIICNGQLREASNDGHTVTTLAMYPKQPFDFAGRTGKVAFDVTNNTQGSHGMWPEVWVTDTPAPAPFTHFDNWNSVPTNAFGIRMSGNAEVGQAGLCPNGNNIGQRRWTVDSATVVRNYAVTDVHVTNLDCVIASAGPNGGFNHVELDVSQNQIDVYATDAGTTSPLKHIAVISNANLSLTRGLVWIEDSHYNADKSPCIGGCPDENTFTWDNVGFDGPFTYHDLSYDALDNTQAANDGSISLGKSSGTNQQASWNVLGLPANPSPQAVRVLFNLSGDASTFNITVNGHAHAVAWPYPDHVGSSWRTFAYLIPISDLVAGTNVVRLGGDQSLITSNVNIVLVNVDGTAPPGQTATPPPNPATTATSVSATATSAAQTCTVIATLNGVDTRYTRPMSECANQ